MGVFARFRRRSSGGSEEPTAAAASGAAQTDTASPADDVEIPRQQSPEEAVDSDGGETPAQSSHTER
jgi:hypothetical protein